MNYWSNKEKDAKAARTHTALMERRLEKRIHNSAARTIIYGIPNIKPLPVGYPDDILKPSIQVVCEDSVTAIFNHSQDNTAVLNFASYKNPGGMFVRGSHAQEECLCSESNLYNILLKFDASYYAWNRKNENSNRSLYTNRALYTPDVVFIRDGLNPIRCDVITCAAPNYTIAKSYHHIRNLDNSRALYARIKFVKMIAEENNVDTLILGAFGCGIFGQKPDEVAKLFAFVFEKTVIKRLIFAIPAGDNYEAFVSQFCNTGETIA